MPPPRHAGGNGGRYQNNLLDDRANFIEYVRNLEQGQAGPGVGGGGGARRRRRRSGGSYGGNGNNGNGNGPNRV